MAHNIVNTTTIWGITNQVMPSNAGPGGDYLTVGPEQAGRVKKINTVIVTNTSTTTDYEASVYNYIGNQNGVATTIHLAKNVVVPAKSSMVIVSGDNPIYVLEGGYLGCFSNVVSTLTFTASYEVLF
jgi:hypothetical protein|tara:strand:+ start:203 stop:583 length:381 start_codon:yes stop_codon:yes gene_type:complete